MDWNLKITDMAGASDVYKRQVLHQNIHQLLSILWLRSDIS